jgi:hypothetical protein
MSCGDDCKDFLVDRAQELMDKLQSWSALGVQLPTVLTSRAPPSTQPTTKKSKSSPEPAAKVKPAKTFRHASEEHTNTNPHHAGSAPTGTDFLDLFKDRATGMKNWPKFAA